MQYGWIYQPEISYYELLLLNNVLQKHQSNFCYCPLAVAKREEYGTKYHFLCIARPLTSYEAATHFIDIEVYKPEKGCPYISKMKRLNIDSLLW